MPNPQISIEDAKKLGEAIGPSIREGIRTDLDAQTREINGKIGAHDTTVRQLIQAHENSDDQRFSEIDNSLRNGNMRMSKIETKLSYGAGIVAALVVVIPVLWDLAKWKMGIK